MYEEVSVRTIICGLDVGTGVEGDVCFKGLDQSLRRNARTVAVLNLAAGPADDEFLVTGDARS